MALQYTYVKERRRFGRPYSFFLRNEILANYTSVKKEGKKFLTKWSMDKSTEKTSHFAVASVNTDNAEYVSNGMFHVEGGWPKEVDTNDEEQTLRYKKKLQRSEEYRIEMTRNLESMTKAVMQNAGVNVYENYFDKADSANVLECFRHPNTETMCPAPATKVSFSIEETSKLAVAYSHLVYLLNDENVTCPLVWDIVQKECSELHSNSSCSALDYHKKYANIIAGGQQNGQVCIWDVRDASEPCIIGGNSHQGCVTCIQWSHRSNFEMLSGSSNGEVFWWDIRKMSEHPCQFKIDSIETEKKGADDPSFDSNDGPIHKNNACTAVDFDKAHSRNIRIGTGNGRIIFAQRHDKNQNTMEKVKEVKCHDAFVSALAQNWASFKCVLTVDSCDIKIWCEDMKTDPIFSLSSIENEFSCGSWSHSRYSRFFIGKIDGSIQFWDLTYNHNEPYFVLKPTCGRVNDVRTNFYGSLMACCYHNGDVYALKVVDQVPGITKNITIEELNIENDEKSAVTFDNE